MITAIAYKIIFGKIWQHTVLGCPVFTLFSQTLSLYDLQGANRLRNPLQKIFENFRFFMPGGDFEIFLGVNDVTRHMLHG